MLAEPQLLVALVLAHLLTDFYFQPFTWVQQRNERHALALPLYLHAIIHGILAAAAMFLFSSTISIASIGVGAIFHSATLAPRVCGCSQRFQFEDYWGNSPKPAMTCNLWERMSLATPTSVQICG